MKTYSIWAEGYAATGQSSGATRLGVATGDTFTEAVRNLAASDPEFASYLNPGATHYWGCRLFDNENDARRSFG